MEKFKRNILPIVVFAKIDIRRLFRDKVGIFFVFAFPLIFLVIFGGLFGGDNTDVSFNVGVVNNSQTEFARDFEKQLNDNKVFDVDKESTSLDTVREKLSRSELDAAIILPDNFGTVKKDQAYPSGEVTVLYAQSNQSAATTLQAVLNSVFERVNNQYVPGEKPFTVKTQSTADAAASQFDYTFSGLLGFALLSLGVFGPANVFPRLKSKGVLRRYRTTTLKVWQYFVGNVISNAAAGLLSVASMFAVAILAFDLNMRGNYFTLALLVILGVTVLFGIGLAVGGWAKNENQAAPLSQIVAFPMIFLSGSFFPRFLMPEWLQTVSGLLPLTPIIDGVRLIITENASFMSLGPQFGLLALWAVAIYLLAFRVFRWE